MICRIFITAAISTLLSLSCVFAAEGADRGRELGGFCTSCHGTNGVGPGNTIPNIGGQTKEFLIIAMNEMKNNQRYATLMQTVSVGYDADEIKQLADWFSSWPPKSPAASINRQLAEKGQALSADCAPCHGKKGEGFEETPRIAAQPAQYLYYAMLEYKAKMRNSDGNAPMMDMIDGLSDDEIKALAEYYSGLK